MTGELDIYGVFVPALGAWMLAAYAMYLLASRVLNWGGVYRYVWHRPLFDLALYVLLLGIIVLLATRLLQ
jgi:Protein of unknown function (DUF1656)